MSDKSYTIHSNGSFDICIDGISLSGIVPSINEHPILPSSVKTENDSVEYVTDKGTVRISMAISEDKLVLSTEAEFSESVHDIEPVGSAILSGAEHAYVQGFGMEGPSGFHKIADKDLRSFGLIGLSGSGKAASVYAKDHRQFTTEFSCGTHKAMYSEEEYFSCGFDLEETCSGKVKLPDLYFDSCEDVILCMKNAAKDIAEYMNARISMESAFHWCSWYYYYENMSQMILDGFLDDLKHDPVNFRYIQIDAGYTDHTGDWSRINARYPEGLGKAARDIINAGYKAGIWIAPFMVGDRSETYKNHPDWIIRNKDGSPYVIFRSYTEPKIWGNTDNDYFVLDTTNPDAFEYLKNVFEKLAGYGYSLFKIDFLLWCMVDTSKIIRYDMSRTSVQVLRDVLKMIRETAGEDGYILASIAPYMPCIGFADGVRIAGDMGASWKGAYGPENLLKELPYDNYFNNIFWQNDPDSVILRDFGTHLSEKETLSLALLQALSGGVITTSDPVTEISDNRKKLLEFIRPTDERVHGEMPFLTENRKEMVITHKLNDWNLLYVLNPTDHPIDVFYRIDELFGTKALFQYRFNLNDGKAVESEKISYFSDSIAPHDSVLLFVTEKPLTERPTNLWHR